MSVVASASAMMLPVLNIGANAAHVPFHTTWAHELVSDEEEVNEHLRLKNLTDLLKYLD